MAENSLLHRIGISCNLLMAALFALSACFQFNDSDWYFWIPLYVTASAVNLANWAQKPNSRMARFSLWLGVFLFIKVSIEDHTKSTAAVNLIDMRDRIGREKFGSGLVITSTSLLLLQNSNPQISKYGMMVLVGTAYGLSFIFFAFQHHQMKY